MSDAASGAQQHDCRRRDQYARSGRLRCGDDHQIDQHRERWRRVGWRLVPPGGTGITINAGVNDRINLRGLIIEGAGTGSTGIHFVSGKSLTIGKCIVRNLANSGIAISPSTPNVFSDVVVTDTILADTGGHGIYIQPSGNVGVTAVFNRVEAYSNAQDGIGAYANLMPDGYGVLVTVESSVAANNGVGFRAFTMSGKGPPC
ncbi:MAG TPA: right-handed parallel beta-helix repeat-containing protein [Casimicrobiaceae bacterium]